MFWYRGLLNPFSYPHHWGTRADAVHLTRPSQNASKRECRECMQVPPVSCLSVASLGGSFLGTGRHRCGSRFETKRDQAGIKDQKNDSYWPTTFSNSYPEILNKACLSFSPLLRKCPLNQVLDFVSRKGRLYQLAGSNSSCKNSWQSNEENNSCC